MVISDILITGIYILAIILLVILIILGIKLIIFVDKSEKLVDDINKKVSSFDSIFKILDYTSDKLTIGVSTIIDSIVSLINKIFKKRKKEDEYYE